MINVGDLQYHVPIRIGGQEVQGIVDTGSFELVVFAKRCPSCGRSAVYDERRSRSFWAGGNSEVHAYGSGTCNTQDGYDKVDLGCYTAGHQPLWLAVECSMPLLQSASFNAIVGIGPPGQPEFTARSRIAEVERIEEELAREGRPVPNKLSTIKQQAMAALEAALAKTSMLEAFGISAFSTCFGRAFGAPAYMIWNDSTRADMPGVKQVPVIGNITWGIHLQDVVLVGVDGVHWTIGCENGCGAIIDTGTSLFGTPSSVFQKAMQALRKISPTLDCSDLSEFPDLTFKVGGHVVRFPPSSYMGTTVGRLDERAGEFLHLERQADGGKDLCQLLLMNLGEELTSAGPMFLLGMPFFREYYTTFSLGRGLGDRSVFISPAGENCEPDFASAVKTFATKRQVQKRQLDASKIRVPRWLHGHNRTLML